MAIRCLVGKGHKQGFLRLLHSSSSSPSLSPVPIPTKPATKIQRSPVNFVKGESQGRLPRIPLSSFFKCTGTSTFRPRYEDDDFMFKVQFALDSIGQIEKKKYELVGLLLAKLWGVNITITLEAKAGGRTKFYEATITDTTGLERRLTLSGWNACWPDPDIRKSYNKLQFKGRVFLLLNLVAEGLLVVRKSADDSDTCKLFGMMKA